MAEFSSREEAWREFLHEQGSPISATVGELQRRAFVFAWDARVSALEAESNTSEVCEWCGKPSTGRSMAKGRGMIRSCGDGMHSPVYEPDQQAASSAVGYYPEQEPQYATPEDLYRHEQKQGVSYADAWRYFERQGFDMSRVVGQDESSSASEPSLDPTPIWGFSGKRYPFDMLGWVADNDGPPDFEPDEKYSQIRDDYEFRSSDPKGN